MDEPIKCTCTGVIPLTPVTPIVQVQPSSVTTSAPVTGSSLTKALKNAGQAMKESLDSFSDEVPPSTQQEKEQKARNILSQFTEYIKGPSFHRDVNIVAREMNVSPKKLATNFFEKVLGTIGDIAGIVVNTVGNVAHTIVDLLARVANCGIDIICKVANALVSVCTLNKTCVAR